jgi:hypothetical protein
MRFSTTKAVRTRRLRSLWRFRIGAVAGLALATTLALLPSAPAFGATIPRPDPPLHAAQAVSHTGATKPVLSTQPADYVPATINGQAVVIDPRSSAGKTDPACEIPPDGAVFTPLANPTQAATETLGGVWTCNGPVPSAFVVGVDAVKTNPGVATLSKKSLYAPGVGTDLHSVKTTRLKVDGKRYKVFTATVSPSENQGKTFEVAAVEVRPHLLIATTLPQGTSPVPYLKGMLEAGAGKAPRAGQ